VRGYIFSHSFSWLEEMAAAHQCLVPAFRAEMESRADLGVGKGRLQLSFSLKRLVGSETLGLCRCCVLHDFDKVSHIRFRANWEAHLPNCNSSAMAAIVQSRMQHSGSTSGCSPDIATRVRLNQDSKRSFGGDKSKKRSPG
jgi:hypothetical protein